MATIVLRKFREVSPDVTTYRVVTAGPTQGAEVTVKRSVSTNPGTPKSGGSVTFAQQNQILGPDNAVLRTQPTSLSSGVSVPGGLAAATQLAQQKLHTAVFNAVQADLASGFLPGDSISVDVV